MSAVRRYGTDGRPCWVTVDDGAVGRSHRTFVSGYAAVAGEYAIGESTRSRDLRLQRESTAHARRRAARAK